MKILHIDERQPELPVESQVVLHVRRHLRRNIKKRESTAPNDLAHFFGFPRSDGAKPNWQKAAAEPDPIQAGALIAYEFRPNTEGVVSLGYDKPHIQECKKWLQERKEKDSHFKEIYASDLLTLLELSKARDLAIAEILNQKNKIKHYLPILIQGPTGAGKELLAKSIHEIWKESIGKDEAPWIPLQVAGISKDSINDELFGHSKGAFTSAINYRKGRIEEADGGTLLIDEVGDLPPEAQLRLLRFLQEGEFSRQGENEVRKLNVRVIAATWHNLKQDVKEGKFREDLFYRLHSGSQLVLPYLQERILFFEEILPILLKERNIKAVPVITRSARDALKSHLWFGNIRELISVLDEATSFSSGDTIRLEHLPWTIQNDYSKLPLKKRSIGFLTDEFDGQKITEEQANWRINQLDSIVLNSKTKTSPKEELYKALATLSEINDPEKSHQDSIESLRRAINYDIDSKSNEERCSFWINIINKHENELPDIIKNKINIKIKEIKDSISVSSSKFKVALDSANLNNNKWLSIISKAEKLPVFKGLKIEFLMQLLSLATNAIATFNPDSLEEFKNEIHTGNIIKGMNILLSPLKAINELDSIEKNKVIESKEEEEYQVRAKYSSLPKDYWVKLTEIDSLRNASLFSEIDAATIKKYLKIHGIENPWKKNLSPGLPSPEQE